MGTTGKPTLGTLTAALERRADGSIVVRSRETLAPIPRAMSIASPSGRPKRRTAPSSRCATAPATGAG